MYGEHILKPNQLLECNRNTEVSAILTIIACHTSSTMKINALIHNLKYYLSFSKTIIICNSTEFASLNIEKRIQETYPKEYSKIIFAYKENDSFVCQGKWVHCIQLFSADLHLYSNYVLTNDSFLLTRNIDDLSQKFSPLVEMQSMCVSNEVKHHYTDFFRVYNMECII